jgi:hypothetical protein
MLRQATGDTAFAKIEHMPDNMEHVQALKILLFINMGQVRYRA